MKKRDLRWARARDTASNGFVNQRSGDGGVVFWIKNSAVGEWDGAGG